MSSLPGPHWRSEEELDFPASCRVQCYHSLHVFQIVHLNQSYTVVVGVGVAIAVAVAVAVAIVTIK